MCGIAALLAIDRPANKREAAVRKMIDSQKHRGPDDAGLISSGAATIGMCRLAIFDPANGRQPMTTADGRYHLVFNGAIYNFKELRATLEADGASFRTNCDTEVLLAAFARWGEACLPRLRGMFAFICWDSKESRLFAARDPLGIKPLYHARTSTGDLVIASELRAVFAAGLIDREIDPVSVGEYLAWFSVPAPRTIFRGVRSLPPGHLLVCESNRKVSIRRWWTLPDPKNGDVIQNYGDFVSELRKRIEDSIRAHQLADVPVGAFLSGGLDSTAIVGLMRRAGTAKLKTFSLVFDEPGFSEEEGARMAASAFGTEHHEERMTGGRIAAELRTILDRFDQPTGDGINTYCISRAAAAGGVKVALSGLGGDELFGSYPSFRDVPRLSRLLPLWRTLPKSVRARALSGLRTMNSTRAHKLADFLNYARDIHELASLRRRVLPETTRLSLLSPAVKDSVARLGPNHPMLDDFVNDLLSADDFQIVSAWELRTYMTDVLLRDSDVLSMTNSIELRVPFVDGPLITWLWPQRADFKMREGHSKRALRDAVADVVPAPLLDRPKRGFTLPFQKWMRNELRDFLETTFSPASLDACPWLDSQTAISLWTGFRDGDDDRAWSRVWTVAVLVDFANQRRAA